MPRPHPYPFGQPSPRSRARRALFLATTPLLLFPASPAAFAADRVYGIDVSQYQGAVDWPTVYSSGGKDFAFVRASRGGTSGTSPGGGTSGTGLARYDDPMFLTNINGATAAGLLAAPYHFARPDVTTANGYSATSTGADEAAHFLQVAGPWMKPGYLPPVLDLEAGASQRSADALAQWAVDFGNAIHAAKGVYPIVYTTSSYANDPSANAGRGELRPSVAAVMPNLWLARTDPNSDPANGDPVPALNYANPYGVWNPTYPNTPNPAPWKFWQYTQAAPQGTVDGVPAAIDLDVAHGDIEYLRDFQVPALWKSGSGAWSTQSNWNTDADPNDVVTDAEDPSFYYPYHNDPTRGGNAPAGRLPNANDNVVLDNSLTPGPYTVTIGFPSTVVSVRRLTNAQTLTISSTLNVAKSFTTSGTTTVSGSSTLNVTESLTITPGASLSSSTGTLNFGTAASPITISNVGTLTQGSGHLNVSANSSITNSGTMSLGGKANFGNNTTLTNSGTLTLGTFGGWGPGSSLVNTAGSATLTTDAGSASSANLAVTAGGSPGVTFSAKQHLASLAIPVGGRATLSPSGTHPLSTRALSIAPTGQLQVADNALLIDYPDASSPADAIRGHLQGARIQSSSADATHRLGYIDSAQLPASRWSTTAWSIPDDTTLLVALTLTGDANFDGALTADDYALLDRSFAKSLTSAHWTDGDFNYDGAITSADYLLIDTAYGQAQGFSPGFLATRESQFGDAYVSDLLASVPEPSSLACLFAGLALTRRRPGAPSRARQCRS